MDGWRDIDMYGYRHVCKCGCIFVKDIPKPYTQMTDNFITKTFRRRKTIQTLHEEVRGKI